MTSSVTRLLIPALLGAALAVSVQAAEVANPQWKVVPAPSAFAATHPQGGPDYGTVVLGCTLQADGTVKFCALRSETPEGQGFAAAALKLAPLYRMDMPPAGYTQKDVDDGLIVPLTIAWRPSVISVPQWLTAPSASDIGNAFPERAMRLGQEGAATLECTVTPEGTMEKCIIATENPPGRGFGEAALSLAGKFRMAASTRDGSPVGGAKVRLPILFKIR